MIVVHYHQQLNHVYFKINFYVNGIIILVLIIIKYKQIVI